MIELNCADCTESSFPLPIEDDVVAIRCHKLRRVLFLGYYGETVPNICPLLETEKTKEEKDCFIQKQ